MKKFQLGKTIFTMSVALALTPAVVFADDTAVVNPPPKPQVVPGTVTTTTPNSVPAKQVPPKAKKKVKQKQKAPVPSSTSNSSNQQLKDVPDPMDLNSD